MLMQIYFFNREFQLRLVIFSHSSWSDTILVVCKLLVPQKVVCMKQSSLSSAKFKNPFLWGFPICLHCRIGNNNKDRKSHFFHPNQGKYWGRFYKIKLKCWPLVFQGALIPDTEQSGFIWEFSDIHRQSLVKKPTKKYSK